MVAALSSIECDQDCESQWVRRAREGDHEAFAQLVQHYQAAVFRTVVRIIHDRDDANDVVQDVWLRASSQLAQLRDPKLFAPWLLRIARNRSIDSQRAKKRRPESASPANLNMQFDVVDTTLTDPAQRLILLHDQQMVRETLSLLTEADRTILILREVRGMEYAEIATALGTSRNAAEVRAFRARARFRRLFTQRDELTAHRALSSLQARCTAPSPEDTIPLEPTIRRKAVVPVIPWDQVTKRPSA